MPRHGTHTQTRARPDEKMSSEHRWWNSLQKRVQKMHTARKRRQRDKIRVYMYGKPGYGKTFIPGNPLHEEALEEFNKRMKELDDAASE